MPNLQKHLRQTFLAGILAAVPVAVTAFIFWYVDAKTRAVSTLVFHREIPFVGVLIAIAAIYLCGLIATTLLGKFCLRLVDRALSRIPVLNPIYVAWKQVLITPGGTEGVFAKVVLIPDASGGALQLGFCSGQPIAGDPQTLCVFVPAAPNPMNGRMYFVRTDNCHFVDASPEDAFKMILSTGNYVPPAVSQTTRVSLSPPPLANRSS